MKDKRIINLIVKGEIDVNGTTIKHIEGGFGENQKCLTCKDIAKVHNMEQKEVNKSVNRLIDKNRMIKGIDYIDILPQVNTLPVNIEEDFGIKEAYLNRVNNIFLLSQRGYCKLVKAMDDDKSWEAFDNLLNEYFYLKEENKTFKKYSRSNNRFTTKCLLNLDGKKDNESDYLFLVNNAVRNEVERAIEQVGIKAGIIAVNANIKENTLSNWRTRRQNLSEEELERIVDVIVKFKDFLD